MIPNPKKIPLQNLYQIVTWRKTYTKEKQTIEYKVQYVSESTLLKFNTDFHLGY